MLVCLGSLYTWGSSVSFSESVSLSNISAMFVRCVCLRCWGLHCVLCLDLFMSYMFLVVCFCLHVSMLCVFVYMLYVCLCSVNMMYCLCGLYFFLYFCESFYAFVFVCVYVVSICRHM